MTKIYTATSWKNEKTVKMLAKMLRDWGHEVYCFAEEADNQVIFDWSDVTGPDHDGISALETPVSQAAFKVDLGGLDWADCCLLINPCGRDAHMEAGYTKGQGKKLYILGEWPKGEFSNMYHFADALVRYDSQGLSYLYWLLNGAPHPAPLQSHETTPGGHKVYGPPLAH